MAKKRRAKKRTYTDEYRAEALAALAANDGNVKRTARQLGVPYTTLKQWAKGIVHPEARANAQPKKELLADRLEELAHLLLDDLARPEKIMGASLPHVATALGIAVDKMQLLRGLPTVTVQNEYSSLSDDELKRLLAEKRLETERGEGTGAAGGTATPADSPDGGRRPRQG